MKKILLSAMVLATMGTFAQVKVGDNPTTIDSNALFEMESTNKGLLLPRVALTSLLSPAPLTEFKTGMQVYNTATAGTAPDNVSPGVYVATSRGWEKQVANLFGARGDIRVDGNSTIPTYTIANTVVTSPKLATSLKVGGGSPATSSVALEVTGGTKGFVVSTTGNLNSITDPVVGMMAYSTTENCLRIYTATGWSNCLLTAAGDASTNGSGIVSAYAAGVDKSVTPVYGKRVASTLNTTTSATVGTAGGYNIIASSATLPGLIFTGTGTFAGTGAQTVTLTATGAIDTAYAGMAHTFTSNTTPSFSFTLTVAAMTYVTGTGSTFNAFYNGYVNGLYTGDLTTVTHTTGDVFSSNSSCASKTISQTSPANCTGTVTGGTAPTGSINATNVYPLVWINGQCWFQRNLNEIPSNFPTSGSTTVPNTNLLDIGLWGFANLTTTNLWGATELTSPQAVPAAANVPAASLYQWSAAMNGSTTERAQGICPTGYHIPSDCEWQYLEHGLGMSVDESQMVGGPRANTLTTTGTVGSKLRGTSTASGNNVSGFSHVGSSLYVYLSSGTSFTFVGGFARGEQGTSTENSSTGAYSRFIQGGTRGVTRKTDDKNNAMAYRCLKDN